MTSTDVRTDSVANSAMPGSRGHETRSRHSCPSPTSIAPRASTRIWAGAWMPISPSATTFGCCSLRRPARQASIIFGTGVRDVPRPGSAERLVLVVQDIDAARADLVARGVDVSEVFHGTGFRASVDGPSARPGPERRPYSSFASFTDPDGNEWVLQEITQRLPGR